VQRTVESKLSSMQRARAVKAALWSAAEGRGHERGYSFSHTANNRLRRLVAKGARNLARHNKVAPESPQMARAKANLSRLIDEMVDAVEERGGGEIDIIAFKIVFTRLCPGLFPFC
jgi:hypothetical protein